MGVDGGRGQRKLIVNQKTRKKNVDQDGRWESEDLDQRIRKNSLGQPFNMAGGQTLVTGGAALDGDQGDQLPKGGAMQKRQRWLGF